MGRLPGNQGRLARDPRRPGSGRHADQRDQSSRRRLPACVVAGQFAARVRVGTRWRAAHLGPGDRRRTASRAGRAAHDGHAGRAVAGVVTRRDAGGVCQRRRRRNRGGGRRCASARRAGGRRHRFASRAGTVGGPARVAAHLRHVGVRSVFRARVRSGASRVRAGVCRGAAGLNCRRPWHSTCRSTSGTWLWCGPGAPAGSACWRRGPGAY